MFGKDLILSFITGRRREREGKICLGTRNWEVLKGYINFIHTHTHTHTSGDLLTLEVVFQSYFLLRMSTCV